MSIGQYYGLLRPGSGCRLQPRIPFAIQQACATGWLPLCGLNCSSSVMESASQIFTVSPVDIRRVTSSMAATPAHATITNTFFFIRLLSFKWNLTQP